MKIINIKHIRASVPSPGVCSLLSLRADLCNLFSLSCEDLLSCKCPLFLLFEPQWHRRWVKRSIRSCESVYLRRRGWERPTQPAASPSFCRKFVTKISVWAAAGVCFHPEKDSFIHLLTGGGGGRGNTPIRPGSSRAPPCAHSWYCSFNDRFICSSSPNCVHNIWRLSRVWI